MSANFVYIIIQIMYLIIISFIYAPRPLSFMYLSTFITRRVWEEQFGWSLRKKILRYVKRTWIVDKMFVANLIDYLHTNVFDEESEQIINDIYAVLDTLEGDGTEC